MSLSIQCPNAACAKVSAAPDGSSGKTVRCKHCGHSFVARPTVDGGASETRPSSAPSTTGVSAVGRFQIRQRLGAGAFGTVYRAYDPQLDREVAVKVPNPGVLADPKRVERFLREARAAAQLRHPHIVPVFDAGKDGDALYIASAFVEGRTLADTIDEHGVDFARAARLVRELAEALAYAHGEGVVHRDVKPDNVLVDGSDRVHLMDFGLAARQDDASRLTSDGAVMGTPSYMAPEQAAGKAATAGPAADQYAAGVVLYELLTGRVPFEGPVAVVIHNAIHTPPEPPSKFRPYVPKDLETICLKAMAKAPADRYPNCQAMADDLRRWQEGEPITARRQTPVERLTRWARKNRSIAGLCAAVVAALLLGAVVSTAFAVRAGREAERADREAGAAREALGQAEANARREAEARAVAQGEQKRAEAESLRADRQRVQAEQATVQAVEAQRAEEAALYASRLGLAFHQIASGKAGEAARTLANCPAERRGWEWGWLSDWANRGTPAFGDTPLPVDQFGFRPTALAVSPDGQFVATGITEGIRVSDLIDGTRGYVIPLPSRWYARELRFSPDGRALAAHEKKIGTKGDASPDVVAVHTLATRTRDWEVGLAGWTEGSVDLAFRPDGRQLAVRGRGHFLLLNRATGQVADDLGARLKVRPADDRFVFVADGGRLIGPTGAYDLAAGTAVGPQFPWTRKTDFGWGATPPGQPGLFAVTRDDRRLVHPYTGPDEGRSVSAVDLATGRATVLVTHPVVVTAIAASADSGRVYSGDRVGRIKVSDVNTGTELFELPGPQSEVLRLSADPDGRGLIAVYGTGLVRRWGGRPAAGGGLVTATPGGRVAPEVVTTPVQAIAFGPDGSTLVVAGKDNSVRVLEWPSGRSVADVKVTGVTAFSPDRTRLAVMARSRTRAAKDLMVDQSRVTVLDAATLKEVARWSVPVQDVVFWSGKGDAVFTFREHGAAQQATSDGDLFVKQVAVAAPPATTTVPNGVRLLCGSPNVNVLWGVRESFGPSEFVRYDHAARKEIDRVPIPGPPNRVTAAAVNPTGSLVVYGDLGGRICRLDVAGRKVEVVPAHSGAVSAIAFATDGTWLASAGEDETVHVWDARSGLRLYSLAAAVAGRVHSLAVSPDGRWLVAGGNGTGLTRWDIADLRGGNKK